MNPPTPESSPPESEPPSNPPSAAGLPPPVTPSETDANKDTLWRKVYWSWSIIAVLALVAFAVHAYQKVRDSSQDKALLGRARMLAAAADQYFLENSVSTVNLDHLVGRTNYMDAVNTVAYETYPVLLYAGDHHHGHRRNGRPHGDVRSLTSVVERFEPGLHRRETTSPR